MSYDNSVNLFLGLSSYGKDVKIDSSNSVYVLVDGSGFAVVKYDSSGNLLWDYIHPDTGYVHRLEITPDQGVVIPYGQNRDLKVLKLSSSGSVMWEKSYDLEYWEGWPTPAAVDDSGYIFVGDWFTTPSSWQGFFILKLDSLGDTLWTVRHDNPDTALCQSLIWDVETDGAGGVYAIGEEGCTLGF